MQALEKIVEGVTTFSLLTLNGLETTLKNLEGLVLKVAKFEVDKVGDQIFEKLDELKKGRAFFVENNHFVLD